ncbi:MAG: YtxH domain-containing protein [Rhodocyclales bacterium]|nr:YtxH domain-containing protein [Rhodocyclales bacterium]
MAKKKDKKRMKREMEAAMAAAMWNAGTGMGAPANGNRGLLGRLGAARPNEQFLLGALLGAAAIYVLGDEKLRGKIMKSGMNLYANILGSIEEMKEQAADLRAELETGRNDAA